MESLLSDSSIQAELAAFKATADLLASQKLRLANSFVPPVEQRPKRATLVNVPVCAPPSTAADDDTAGPSTETVYNLTIKSLKPPLALALAASPTATIGDLKARLAEQYPGQAPAAETQRWILKGKAMGDNKLLKEFAVAPKDTVINLMITKAAPASAPSLRSPAPAAAAADPGDVAAPRAPPSPKSPTHIPELTLSEPDPVTGHARRSSVSLTNFDDLVDRLPLSSSPTAAEHPSRESSSLLAGVAATDFWLDIRRVCEEKFGPSEGSSSSSSAPSSDNNRNRADAQKVWEAMFAGARDWISPSQKALIREQVGYSAMGGC
ncbi:hypothetical protein RHOSPDRAFT_36672 [Rhodotorula sp. JG-1b]|nr:hypothetical protein RHOSPDRAFT_36672 [Rhodotorula sp. JG-1b]